MGQEESARLLARLTLILASFMLLVLFSVPLLMDTSGFDDFLPYALYSLLLASIGVLIGTSLTWLNLAQGVEAGGAVQAAGGIPGAAGASGGIPGAAAGAAVGVAGTDVEDSGAEMIGDSNSDGAATPSSAAEQSPFSRLSTDEALVVEYLRSRGGKSWQAELVRDLNLSASKASRLLTRLERSDLVHRIRDGMGKRVVLNGGDGIE